MGTPIQLGSPGGFDRNKLLLIGGVVVAAIVLLGKVRGGASASGGGDQVVPTQAIQLGQLDYDLRTATNDLATRIADVQAHAGDQTGRLEDLRNGENRLLLQSGQTIEGLNANQARLEDLRNGENRLLLQSGQTIEGLNIVERLAATGRDYSYELYNRNLAPGPGDSPLFGAHG